MSRPEQQMKEIRSMLGCFTDEMRAVLYKNMDKGGWKGCSDAYLFKRLLEEVAELGEALFDKELDRIGVKKESADVANIAAMIFDNDRNEI